MNAADVSVMGQAFRVVVHSLAFLAGMPPRAVFGFGPDVNVGLENGLASPQIHGPGPFRPSRTCRQGHWTHNMAPFALLQGRAIVNELDATPPALMEVQRLALNGFGPCFKPSWRNQPRGVDRTFGVSTRHAGPLSLFPSVVGRQSAVPPFLRGGYAKDLQSFCRPAMLEPVHFQQCARRQENPGQRGSEIRQLESGPPVRARPV